MEIDIKDIEAKLAEAIHQMLMIERDRYKLRIAIPVLVYKTVFRQCNFGPPPNFKEARFMDIKMVDGYEKAIVVFHENSAIHDDLKPIKIELNI